MKKAGIIGGIGPASTLDYYNDIINGYRKQLETNEYPKIVIDSVNMTEMISYISEKRFNKLVELLLGSLQNLAAAGADFAAIASNTPHIVFDEIKEKSPIPIISIVEETCNYAKSIGCKNVVVLGTLFTMENGFYNSAFDRYGIRAVAPDQEGRKAIHSIIFPNLENGIILPEEKSKMLALASGLLKENQADALVLGCTELPLMIKPGDIDTMLLNTTQIHVKSIIKEIIG